MACDDPRFRDFLSDAVLGRLSNGELFQLRSHLIHCQDCRETIRAACIIAGKDAESILSNLNEHVTEEQLARYYAEPSGMSASETHSIEAHLEQCSVCGSELLFMEAAERQMSNAVSLGSHTEADSESWMQKVQSIFLRPAFAYSLLVVIVFPMILLMLRPEEDRRPAGITIPPAVELRETNRASGEAQSVVRENRDAFLHLSVPYPHSKTSHSYEVTVGKLDDGHSVAVDSWVSLIAPGKVDVILHSTFLNDGRHVLNLLEIDNNLTDTLLTPFLFNLETLK